ncbi:pyrroline-5-carboxylate reductase [Streptococcus dentasini]
MKIGFIGLGNMGGAIAESVAKLEVHELLLSNHNPVKAEQIQKACGGEVLSNEALIEQADLVFLGIKPQFIAPILEDLSETIAHNPETVWVSMAAGVTIEQLSTYLPTEKIVRMMPNTPVAISQGMTTFTTRNPQLELLFEEVMVESGQVQKIPEKLMDAATAIAGCGPAFVYEIIDILTQAGVQNGLSAVTARRLAAQTLLGASQMVLESDRHPSQLRDEVTSPGGSTIAGLLAMTQAGLQASLVQGINQALERTKELTKDK